MNVGESEIAALEMVGEFGVLDAEEVEDGGVKVVEMDFVLVALALMKAQLISECTDTLIEAFGTSQTSKPAVKLPVQE